MRENWKLMHLAYTGGWVDGKLASLLEVLQMQGRLFFGHIQFLQENTA